MMGRVWVTSSMSSAVWPGVPAIRSLAPGVGGCLDRLTVPPRVARLWPRPGCRGTGPSCCTGRRRDHFDGYGASACWVRSPEGEWGSYLRKK